MKEFAHFHCHHSLPLGQIGQTAKWLQVMCPTEKKMVQKDEVYDDDNYDDDNYGDDQICDGKI